jgi:hypothetical protein
MGPGFPSPMSLPSHSTIGATLTELPISSISREARASSTGMSQTSTPLMTPRAWRAVASSSRRSDVQPDRMWSNFGCRSVPSALTKATFMFELSPTLPASSMKTPLSSPRSCASICMRTLGR